MFVDVVKTLVYVRVSSKLKDESILSCLCRNDIVHASFFALFQTDRAAAPTCQIFTRLCLSKGILDGDDAEGWLALPLINLLQQLRIVSVGSHVESSTVGELIHEVYQLTCIETFRDPCTAAWVCELQLLANIVELDNSAKARPQDIVVFVYCGITVFFNALEYSIEFEHLIEGINSEQII